MIPLTVNQIILSPGATTPPTIALYIADYYTRVFTLIDDNISIDSSGNITSSPLPTISVDPTAKYVLRAINEQCGYQHEQNVFITIYCIPGYTLNGTQTLCVLSDMVAPNGFPVTPSVAVHSHNDENGLCGTFINSPGYNLNGTGTTTRITLANSFWKNGIGDCKTPGNDTDSPLNRSGISSTFSGGANQYIGFSVCISDTTDKTYYIGVGGNERMIIRVNGVDIVNMDKDAIDAQYDTVGATKYAWMIYPVTLTGGILNVVEMISLRTDGKPVLGAEIYDNTSAEIIAATGYGGLNLVFSTKDTFGDIIPIANNGIGYTCPSGYSLQTCASPFACSRVLTTTPLYG